MSKPNLALSFWQRISPYPGGKWIFSRAVCLKAPYCASIRPRFEELRPGFCAMRVPKRRAVLNHLGTVHAIAMCNVAELAAAMMTDVSIPATHRWIPKGMTVEYLKKAETSLRGVAELQTIPTFGEAGPLLVTVLVSDTHAQVVFRAVITMWVSPKK